MDTKVCTICFERKDLSLFVKRSNRKSGVQPYCKSCHSISMSKTNRSNYTRNYSLLKTYSISHEEYLCMLEKQDGKCYICKFKESDLLGGKKHLCVDHCHKTKRVRGLLCDKCNRGIGLLQDSPEILFNAYLYLKLSEK